MKRPTTTGSLISFLAILAAVALPSLVQAAPTKTISDLKKAYLGETTASAKYAAYAQKADQEGYRAAAALFRAACAAESIHARKHRETLTALGVKSAEEGSYDKTPAATAENLRDAVKGESYERDVMYPAMLKDARSEKQPKALEAFTFALGAEAQHADLYGKALSELSSKAGKSTPPMYYVCPTCGATFRASAPAACPKCGTEKKRFMSIR